MKAVIFAGGVGSRLWPLSRRKSPKQFERIIGNKSTLELTVDRLRPEFAPEDIFISTGVAHAPLVKKQLNFIPESNIIIEPSKKDVGPAVALVMAYLARAGYQDEPVLILWSDHLVQKPDKFKHILKAAATLIEKDRDRIIFIGQKPRFASENLGWIQHNSVLQKVDGINFHQFVGFKYKPDGELAQKYFKDKAHCWNLGYFVSTPQFILNLFRQFDPTIYNLVQIIQNTKTDGEFEYALKKHYGEMPVINFDNAILEQLDPASAYVVVEDIGWSDIGAWEALKEALEKNPKDTITHGNVDIENCHDNLIYNYQDNKLVVAMDLDDILVVNTDDVLLVAKKSSSGKIKQIVEKYVGTDKESLT